MKSLNNQKVLQEKERKVQYNCMHIGSRWLQQMLNRASSQNEDEKPGRELHEMKRPTTRQEHDKYPHSQKDEKWTNHDPKRAKKSRYIHKSHGNKEL